MELLLEKQADDKTRDGQDYAADYVRDLRLAADSLI